MNFDRVADHYQRLESWLAAGQLQRCRTYWLKSLFEPKEVLFIGEGNGNCLHACLKRFPNVRYTVIDASAKMIELAKDRTALARAATDQVTFIQADVLTEEIPDRQYDLVITAFFFDCFSPAQIHEIVQRIATVTCGRCLWLVSDFQVPDSILTRWAGRSLLWGLYQFFGRTAGLKAQTLTEPDQWLQNVGFILKQRAPLCAGLLRSDVWQRGIE